MADLVNPVGKICQEVVRCRAVERLVAGIFDFRVGDLIFRQLHEPGAEKRGWANFVNVTLGEEDGNVGGESLKLLSDPLRGVA